MTELIRNKKFCDNCRSILQLQVDPYKKTHQTKIENVSLNDFLQNYKIDEQIHYIMNFTIDNIYDSKNFQKKSENEKQEILNNFSFVQMQKFDDFFYLSCTKCEQKYNIVDPVIQIIDCHVYRQTNMIPQLAQIQKQYLKTDTFCEICQKKTQQTFYTSGNFSRIICDTCSAVCEISS